MRSLYRQQFKSLRKEVGMSTRLAAQTATMLVTRLYAPLVAQIDPTRLGEFDRANQIALQYGMRLIEKGKNISEDKLFDLIMGYPSHGFVIDSHEARVLFTRVRAPLDDEQMFTPWRDATSDVRFGFFFDDPEFRGMGIGGANVDQPQQPQRTDGSPSGSGSATNGSDGQAQRG